MIGIVRYAQQSGLVWLFGTLSSAVSTARAESVDDGYYKWASEEFAAAGEYPGSLSLQDDVTSPFTSEGIYYLTRSVIQGENPLRIYFAIDDTIDVSDVFDGRCFLLEAGKTYAVEFEIANILFRFQRRVRVLDPTVADYVYFPHCFTGAYFNLAGTYLRLTDAGVLSKEEMVNNFTNAAGFFSPVVHAIDHHLLAGVLAERIQRSSAARACRARRPLGRCRLLFANFLGRHFLQEFSALFPEAVFLSSAAESGWLAFGDGQHLYYSQGAQKTGLESGGFPMKNIVDATAPHDIPLPLMVYTVWTPRSALWDSRDIAAVFAGAPNSRIRLKMFRLFGDATEREGMYRSLRRKSVLFRPKSPRPGVLLYGGGKRIPIQEISDLMYRARLCLVPDGDQPNTQRLIEAVAHGCVPVIISSRFQPHFKALVAWRKCAIFVRQEEVDRMPEILDDLSKKPEMLRQMHGRLHTLSKVLVHGGLASDEWFGAMMFAELEARRFEGVRLHRERDGRNASGIRESEMNEFSAVTLQAFQWFVGGMSSSTDTFWMPWLIPTDEES